MTTEGSPSLEASFTQLLGDVLTSCVCVIRKEVHQLDKGAPNVYSDVADVLRSLVWQEDAWSFPPSLCKQSSISKAVVKGCFCIIYQSVRSTQSFLG